MIISTLLKRFIRQDKGLSAIEYGLIAALISLLTIASLNYFQEQFSESITAADAGIAKGNSTK